VPQTKQARAVLRADRALWGKNQLDNQTFLRRHEDPTDIPVRAQPDKIGPQCRIRMLPIADVYDF